MKHSQNTSNDRKRKRSYRISRPGSSYSNSVPPSSASSSHVPTQTHTYKLLLKNEQIPKDSIRSSVDESKVIQFLSKFPARSLLNDDLSHITVILTRSEVNSLDTVKNVLIENFQIDDLLTTEGPPGSIDVLVTLYGKMANIAKAITYLIFLLNAKINNLQKDIFTLKSSTYKAHLLLNNGEEVQGIKYIDVVGSHDVFVQADLTSLFNFILCGLESGCNVDASAITLKPMFGIHLDPALKLNLKVNVDVKHKAQSQLLLYLYPKLRYDNI